MRGGGGFGGTELEGGAVAMSGLFVTGTGTDVGKTYVADLIVKKLRGAGLTAGYYKAAASGLEAVPAGRNISYVYREAVSPHLAARLANRPVEMGVIERDFAAASARFEFVVVEGSGGIICPLRWDSEKLLLEDVIRALRLPVVIVAGAGLGTINATVLTAEHLAARKIPSAGIILNRYAGGLMESDNARMVAELTGLPVLARVSAGAAALEMELAALLALFG